MGPKWNPKKTFEETKKGDLRLPTPGEALGKPGSPGWSPAQTAKEISEDPYRAGRLVGGMVATGGIPVTELMTGYEKSTGKKLTSGWYPSTPTMKDIVGQNPRIDAGSILGDGGAGGGIGGVGSADYNPYAAQAKTLAESTMRPDFAAANKTAAAQQSLAQALGGSGGFYSTGAGAVSGLLGNLQRQGAGDFGPRTSLAQAMLQQGLSENIAGVRSQLASQRGLSPALAARYAAQQTAQLGGQTAQQAGILGLQQQIAAQEQLGRLGMGAAELGAGIGGQLMTKGREADITQATAATEADLKKLQVLSSSDVGLKEIAARTGLGEKEIKMKIALANQAAAQGDRELAVKAISGLLQGGAQVLAAKATGGASLAAGAKGGAGGGAAGAGGGGSASGFFYGGRIDGLALKDGDHPQNDVVPAMLSPGEIVIPRTAAKDKKKAKAFLDALDGWDEKPSYSKVLKARRARA